MNSDSVANMYAGVFPKEQYTTFHKMILMWLKNDSYIAMFV